MNTVYETSGYNPTLLNWVWVRCNIYLVVYTNLFINKWKGALFELAGQSAAASTDVMLALAAQLSVVSRFL